MIGWLVLLILVCAALVAGYALLLPKCFLKYRYSSAGPTGRGVKIVLNRNARHIVYEPERRYEPYVRRYLLSEKGGKKFLICKIDASIRYLDYDVVLFNDRNRAFDDLRVREKIGRAGYTRAVELPKDTCYVSLQLNRADGICFENAVSRTISKGRLVAFFLLSILLEALGYLGVLYTFVYAFGGIYAESFLLYVQSGLFAIAASAAIAVNGLIAGLVLWQKNRKRD